MKQNKKQGLYLYQKRLPLGNRLVQPRISEPVGERNAGNMSCMYNQCL